LAEALLDEKTVDKGRAVAIPEKLDEGRVTK